MRNRFLIVASLLMLTGCAGDRTSDAPQAVTGASIALSQTASLSIGVLDRGGLDRGGPNSGGPNSGGPNSGGPDFGGRADTLHLDKSASEVAWSGTKMWGRGGHTGTVPIESGWIADDGDRLVAGYVVVDMTSIGITDIPPDQPEPIALLTSHLEDPLFFHVERYPQAFFTLLGSERVDDDLLLVDGLLTIRGVTRSIRIPVDVERARAVYSSRFRIDRFDWNVAYEGGFGVSRFAARNFVDRDIELEIRLEVRD